MSLFRYGTFTLSSGSYSWYKIDCDSLTHEDLYVMCKLLVSKLPHFGSVEGVPTGGDRLVCYFQPFITNGPALLVDDVLTTGASMERQRGSREAIGAVLFARNPPPTWIKALWTMS